MVNVIRLKPRKVVIAFSIYMSLMLFQTAYMSLGTITALGAIALIFITGNADKRRYGIINKSSYGLKFFFAYSVIITALYFYFPPNYIRNIAQIILFLYLCKFAITGKEFIFLKFVLYISMLFYAVLIVRSTFLNPLSFLHDDIYLFGTALDPNYVGIPIVAAAVLALNDILEAKIKWKIIFGIAFFAYVGCIICTASRGSLLSLLIGCGLVLLTYLRRSGFSFMKLVILLLALGAIVLLYFYFSSRMEGAMARLTTMDDDIDNGRFFLWERALNQWKENPIFGYGVGAGYRMFSSANHNSYVELLFNTGLIGAFVFLNFLRRCILHSHRYYAPFAYMLIAVLVQISFLDALDNRCLWCFLCWYAMLPRNQSLDVSN